MCVQEVFTIIKDIALAGAACVTAFVALSGLNKWQKELNGKATFDTARNLAKSVYALRDEISRCRSPFTAAHEFPEEYDNLVKHSAEEEGKAWAHVYAKRWEPVSKALQAFDAATLEAEALWGKGIREKAAELRRCAHVLHVDIQCFIENKFSGGEYFQDKNYAKEVRYGVYNIKPDENKLTKEINSAIESLESVIRPHLSRNQNHI